MPIKEEEETYPTRICGSAAICPVNKEPGVGCSNPIIYDGGAKQYRCISLENALNNVSKDSEEKRKYGLYNEIPHNGTSCAVIEVLNYSVIAFLTGKRK